MEKPNFKKMCLMYIQQLTNFPYIEKDFDALTDYQFLCKVVAYLNKIITNENTQNDAITALYNAFTELKDYVDNYFDNLDVQDEINNKLDEMANDGTLETLLGSYISINNVNYLELKAVLNYRSTSSGNLGMQGGCYAGDGNIVQYITEGKRIQIISLSTGEVLREQSYDFTGHGNSLCLKDGYIYISGLLQSDTSENAIYKINYNDLSDYEKIDIYTTLDIPTSVNLFTITYDNINKKWYMLKALIFPQCTIYRFNEDFTSYDTFTFDNSSNYGGPIVNTCMFKGYYCIFYNDGKLTMLDKNFNIYKNINIEKVFGSRYASEFEWLSQYNDKELIFGIIGYDGKKYGGGNFLYATSNLYASNKTFNKGANPNNLTGKYPKIQEIYVDNTIENPSIQRDGSLQTPFISLYELSNALLTNDINICYLHGDFTNEGLYINNCRNVKIYNWVRENESSSLINVRQLEVENVEQCYLRYIYPINSIEIKESKTTMKFDGLIDNTKILNVSVKNTGHLIFDVNNNKLTVNDYDINEGIIESSKFLRINGFSKYLDSESEPTLYCSCRNLKNFFTRCRYDGSWPNPTTYSFSVPRANALPYVRLSVDGWIPLQYYDNMTKTITLSDGTTLSYTVSTNSSDNKMVDIVVTSQSQLIYDIICVFN